MRLHLLLFLLVVGTALLAQPDNLSFHRLTGKEGLMEGWNWYVYKDSRGFVWISSVYGLNRFDGINVRTYGNDATAPCSLFGQNIQGRFFEDDNSDIWFCTYEAIHCYRRKLDCFDYYFIEKDGIEVQDGYFVFDLDGNGRLWFLSGNKEIWTFDTRTKCFFKIENCNAGRGFNWKNAAGVVEATIVYTIGFPGVELIQYPANGGRERQMVFDGKQPTGHPAVKVRNCYFDGDICWMATDAGLIEYHVPTGRFEIFDTYEGRRLTTLGYAGRYTDDMLVVSSNVGYILFFDKVKRRFVRLFEHREDDPNSLRHSRFSNVYADDWGNIWVSMMKEGLDWTHPGKIHFQYTPPLMPEQGNILHLKIAENGNLLCATRSGIWNLSASAAYALSAQLHSKPFSTRPLICFAASNNNLWAVDGTSLYRYAPSESKWEAVQTLTDQLNEYFTQLLSLKNGGLIALTFQGLRQLNTSNDGAFTLDIIPATDSTAAYYGAFQDSKGRLFVGKGNVGICLLQPRGNTWDSIAWLPVKGNPDCWYEDTASNTLWIGTSLGLVRMNLADFSFRTYTRKDGFPDHNIFSLLADDTGRLWMGTNNGLVLFDPATNQVRSFTRADGLPEEGFTPGVAHRLPTGELLFGCGPRLLVVQPKLEKNLLPRPVIQITGLRVNDEAPFGLRCAVSGANNPEEFRRILLPWRQNTLSFHFTAIEYGDPARNQTWYKLEGYDDHWVSGGNPGFARYPNLPPGSYKLLLLAANSNGDRMDEPKVLEIVILPPWWQTWWFHLAAISVLFLLTFGIYRYRLAQIERLQQMRNQIAEDLHDEVGSSITGIRMFSDAIKMEVLEERPDLVPRLERIGGSATRIMGSIRDIVWAINPATDRLADLADRMREAAAACEAAGIPYRFYAPSIPEHLRINPRVKHNLLLIFKEALNNALKYADASHIDLLLQLEGKLLILHIRDNGKGFDAETIQPGNGLYNMKKRAAAMKGECSLESRLTYGTVVTVRVNVK